MKYCTDIFRILILISILYVGISIWNAQSFVDTVNSNEQLKFKSKIIDSRKSIEKLLIENRHFEACLQAGTDFRSGNISAYFIDVKAAPCWESKEFINLISNQLTPGVLNEFANKDKSKFFAYKLYTNSTEWILINKKNADKTFFQLFKSDKVLRGSIYKEIFIVLQIMLIIIFIFSILLVEDLQGQLRKAGKESKWLSLANKLFGWVRPKYIKMAVSAQAAQIQQTDELTKQLEFISTSLQSTVLQEIKQNKSKIPYTFAGTVARIDINGFSTAVVAGSADQVTTITDTFLQLACELMQRYDGLFEKALGDEVIVVFKENEALKKSSLRAMAFARDLMMTYSQIEFQVGDRKNKFTVKSSLNKSSITFLLGHAGPVFSGDALTYTKRLLDAVTIKDRNIASSFLVEAADYEKLVDLPQTAEKFDFKNMNSAQGYQIEKFLTIQNAYDLQPEYLQYFKSDEDICFLFEKIQTENNPDKLFLIFQCLRQIHIHISSDLLVRSWIAAIEQYKAKAKEHNFKNNYANLISAGLKLIPQNQWTSDCTNAISNISRNSDGRINAAIVELLADKKITDIIINQSESFIIHQDPSFRTEGNLLIAKAMYQLDEIVLSDILEMLESDNTLKLNTGIFVSGQVLEHYEKINPAGLRTFANYKKMIKQLTIIQNTKQNLLSDRMKLVIQKVLI